MTKVSGIESWRRPHHREQRKRASLRRTSRDGEGKPKELMVQKPRMRQEIDFSKATQRWQPMNAEERPMATITIKPV